eukprot:4768759-Amphidinium_carterae.1
MQKAARDKEPCVDGAQVVFQRCLETYGQCTNAMRRAYSDERAVRANPVELSGPTSQPPSPGTSTSPNNYS